MCRKLDVPLVSDLKLLPKGGEDSLPDRDSWHSAGTSTREGVRTQEPLHLWYKLGPSLQELDKNGTKNIITELDVIYGPGPAMPGFQFLQPEITEGRTDVEPVRIAYRRGPLGTFFSLIIRSFFLYTHFYTPSDCACASIAFQSQRDVQNSSGRGFTL